MELNNPFFLLMKAVLDGPNWLIFDWNYPILHKTYVGFEVCIVIGQQIGFSSEIQGQKIF